MEMKNDNRFESTNKQTGNESRPAAPTSTTADNASVYQQPPLENATRNGEADRMEENSTEDRKHTP